MNSPYHFQHTGVECEDFAQSPGYADMAPGSPFNEDGQAEFMQVSSHRIL